jgi:hypothetical protein
VGAPPALPGHLVLELQHLAAQRARLSVPQHWGLAPDAGREPFVSAELPQAA